MFKVLEIHSAYVSGIIIVILHALAAFYLLFILKLSYQDYLPSSKEKKVVWYQTPQVAQHPVTPTAYQKPPVSTESPATEHAAAAEAAVPLPVSPLRKARSPEERKAAWKKAETVQEPRPFTAADFVEAVSQDQASRRHAQAVYTQQEKVTHGAQAQMRELTEGRLRHKLFSAMQMAFDMHTKDFYSPTPIMSFLDLSIVLNDKGEIVAVEVLRSSGNSELDEFAARRIQSVKKIALPPSFRGQEFYTITFRSKVSVAAGSGHIIFDYKDASGVHIV